ncbi:MAG TPA: hypothetical protein VKX17_27205 [Planctomycetota bacterium]|nr:hypothetical protein [Planctomycetota bacterium]
MKRAYVARGSALIVGFAMVVLLAALAVAFASRMTSNQLRVESDIAGTRAYELAQTANTLKIQQVWADFKSKPTNQRVAWVGGEDSNGNGVLDPGEDVNNNGRLDPPNAPNYQDNAWVPGTAGDVCTRIKVLSLYKHDWALVRFTTWARVTDDARGRSALRKIQRVVRFELGPASAFDYAYFANNYASIAGQKLTVYGQVGANGNVDLSGNPLIDGSIFAAVNSDVGSLGVINGSARSDSLSNYRSFAANNPFMRPTNPTADPEDKNKNGKLDPGEDANNNGKLDNFAYVVGYDGSPALKTAQDQEAMPDFSNLDYYRELSQNFLRPVRSDLGEPGGTPGGIVKQLTAPGLDPTNPANYTTLINGDYGFNGESGFETQVASNGSVNYVHFNNKLDLLVPQRNGNVGLIGTAAQPLVVLGPVVVSSDLAIKGVMKGQGTIYTGRNTHVLGDLTYSDPPQWKQNDVYFDTTAANNKQKDIVGFGVGGNVVFGDYTNADTNADQWSTVKGLISPPYTHKEYLGTAQTKGFNLLQLLAWLLSTLDGMNGYNNSNGWFDGNYLGLDGGKYYNNNNSVPLFANRAFYQSSFSKAYIHSTATTNPQNVNGIFYTQHFFGGRLNGMNLLGAMIARDEAIVTDNSGVFYYDPRISKQEPSTYINLFLPRTAALSVISTKDLNADDAVPSSPDW